MRGVVIAVRDRNVHSDVAGFGGRKSAVESLDGYDVKRCCFPI